MEKLGRMMFTVLILFFAGITLFSGISVIWGEPLLKTFLLERWLGELELVNLVLGTVFLVTFIISIKLIKLKEAKART